METEEKNLNREISARDLILLWFLTELENDRWLIEMSITEKLNYIKEFTKTSMISKLIMIYKDEG